MSAGATTFERTTPRLVDPDTEDNLQRQFLENQWTDGLPIVLPTEKRVAAMLAATSRKPDEIVGRMQPTEFRVAWEYTVEKVAVNAVMAGAKPEYFPVILALAASEVSARGSTSSSSAAMVVVNGPIRKEVGMNCGIGAMGPYNHANATIGRNFGFPNDDYAHNIWTLDFPAYNWFEVGSTAQIRLSSGKARASIVIAASASTVRSQLKVQLA